MYKYIIGYYTPEGRKIAVYYADSKAEACRNAWSDGLTVTDCDRS
jgi:hypothetical protein